MLRKDSGRDADPGVADGDDDLLPLPLGGEPDVPPARVYLALLVSRLPNTWASRVRSASRCTGSGGSETVSSCPASSISGRAVSTALLTTSASSTRERRSSILLRLMRGRRAGRR